jgi:putative glutamine amidotransferase
MKVYVATPYLHGSIIHRLFQGHDAEVLPEELDKVITCDVLVFSGGEDVHPSYYGETAPERGWFNQQRDEQEIRIFKQLGRKIIATKVLGICRGHQLLNVLMGGNLVYDIATEYGAGHQYYHSLNWMVETPFNKFLPITNSMHHQGLRKIGNAVKYEILAVEPKTQIVEAVVWGDKYLGVQFHPESLSDDLSRQFCQVIEKWVEGKPLSKVKSEERGRIRWAISDTIGNTSTITVDSSEAIRSFSDAWMENMPPEIAENTESDEEQPF